VVVVPLPEARVFPTVLLIQRDSGRIVLGNFKKNRALSPFTHRCQQSRRHAAPPEIRVHGNIEDFGLVWGDLAPRAESRWLVPEPSWFTPKQGQQQRVSGIIAQRPLGRFGAAVLDTRDGGMVAFQGRPDQNGVGCPW